MIWNVGLFWLMMAVSTVAVLSFLLSLVLDAIVGDEGFGPIGGMIVLSAGFFGCLAGLNLYGIRFGGLQQGVVVGLAGAFSCFALLLFAKALMRRL